MVSPNETSQQPLASPRGWYPGPGTATWHLVATSDFPAKDAYDARPLAKTATSANCLYAAVTVLPQHSRWSSCMPQDSESVTKLCATDSMRTAFTADDQHVVPFSPGNARRARLDFAQDHQHWQLRHCRPILLTDESRFHVSTCDRRYADSIIVEYDRYDGGAVMVMGPEDESLQMSWKWLVVDRKAVNLWTRGYKWYVG